MRSRTYAWISLGALAIIVLSFVGAQQMAVASRPVLELDKMNEPPVSAIVALAVGHALGGGPIIKPNFKLENRAMASAKIEPSANQVMINVGGWAGKVCPGLQASSEKSGCSLDPKNIHALNFELANCSESDVHAVWTGRVRLRKSDGSALRCGHKPSLLMTSLERQFIDGEGRPSTGERINAVGSILKIDQQPRDGGLANFDGEQILPTIGEGFGESVTFANSQTRTQVSVYERLESQSASHQKQFDHTLIGTVELGDTAVGRRIPNSSIQVYDNVLQVIGKTKLIDLVYSDTCCGPISGRVQTDFYAGSNVLPTEAGKRLVGKSETVVFRGCGSATWNGAASGSQKLRTNCL